MSGIAQEFCRIQSTIICLRAPPILYWLYQAIRFHSITEPTYLHDLTYCDQAPAHGDRDMGQHWLK